MNFDSSYTVFLSAVMVTDLAAYLYSDRCYDDPFF